MACKVCMPSIRARARLAQGLACMPNLQAAVHAWRKLCGRGGRAGQPGLVARNALAGTYALAGRAVLSRRKNALHSPGNSAACAWPKPHDTLAVANLAGTTDSHTTLQNQGKDKEAEAVLRDTLKRKQEVLGPEHEHTLNTPSSLAGALQNLGKHAEAEPLMHDTLTTQRRVLGERHLATIEATESLAALLVNTGKPDDAEAPCRRALAHRTLGPEHPTSLRMASMLASALDAQGQTAEGSEGVNYQTLPPGRSNKLHF